MRVICAARIGSGPARLAWKKFCGRKHASFSVAAVGDRDVWRNRHQGEDEDDAEDGPDEVADGDDSGIPE